jgi:hypothetical protein
MKISLVIEADSVDDFVAAIEAINTRPIKVRPFPEAVEVQKVVDTLATLEQEQPPAATAPVAPPAHVEPLPQPAVAGEPAVAAAPVEAKKPRGRPKKAEAATVPPTTEAPAVTTTAGTTPTSSNGGSIDELRKRLMQTFADYVQRYGTNFGYTDVSKMLTDTFGPGVRKSSDVSDDNLARAVAVVGQAIEANPFGRRRADVN